MNRVVIRFVDMIFYSRFFSKNRGQHFKMAYEQGVFDLRMDQKYGSKPTNSHVTIQQSVRDKYMELCPVSTFMCKSLGEIDYKIKRAIFLGKTIKTFPHREVQYYNLRFVFDKNTYEVIKMKKNDDYYNVTERQKKKYDRMYLRVTGSV